MFFRGPETIRKIVFSALLMHVPSKKVRFWRLPYCSKRGWRAEGVGARRSLVRQRFRPTPSRQPLFETSDQFLTYLTQEVPRRLPPKPLSPWIPAKVSKKFPDFPKSSPEATGPFQRSTQAPKLRTLRKSPKSGKEGFGVKKLGGRLMVRA